jgi:PAS domain S-box-containing protein
LFQRETENKTRNLIKQLPKATAFVGVDYNIIHISDSFLQKFEINNLTQKSNNILNLFPNSNKTLEKKLKKAFTGNKKSIERTKYFNSENKITWIEWEIKTWIDENDTIVGAIIQLENITEIIEYEQKLKKLETLLKVKSEVAKIGSWDYNAITDELTWSDMTKLIHEVPLDYIPDTESAVNFYKSGVFRNKIIENFDKCIQEGLSWTEKSQIITAKGKTIWVNSTGIPLIEDNKFIGIIGSFQDITEDIITRQKTKENELMLRTLVDSLPLNVYIKDLKSKKILVNKYECDFLGLSSNEIIGKNDFDLYPNKIAKKNIKQDLKVINTKKPLLSFENTNIKKDGTITHFLTSKIPLLNEEKQVTSIIGFSLDISNLKEKEKELKKLFQVTALQNKKLLDFAHIISHNLRSHTANFSMLLGFLLKEKDETESKKLLDMLISASDNLLETLDDLNNVVEINTNINQEQKKININKEFTVVEKKLKSLIKNKNIKIRNNISDQIEVKGIPEYVENILLNVLSNAVKFSKPNERNLIELSSEKKAHYTVITIKDSGLGIDLVKNKNKFFGMYKTFHHQENSKGIGLFIAKNQIEAMKGKFEVKSKVNVGTSFKIYFNENN